MTFDRKPFILLNLIFSAQAFFAATFVLIAQIRQSARDHAVDQAAALLLPLRLLLSQFLPVQGGPRVRPWIELRP